MYLLATGHILAGALRDCILGSSFLFWDSYQGRGFSLNGWLLLAVTLNALIFPPSDFCGNDYRVALRHE